MAPVMATPAMPRARLTVRRVCDRVLSCRWSRAPPRPLSDLARRAPPRARKPRATGAARVADRADFVRVCLRLADPVVDAFALVCRFTALRLAVRRATAALAFARFFVFLRLPA